jgi:hypothetical protein
MERETMQPDPAQIGLSQALIVKAMRRWRAARDDHAPVQPEVHAVLTPSGLEMFTPVFDSLMTLCEACLGRRLRTGRSSAPSPDETLFCRLLRSAGEEARGPRGSARPHPDAFVCALRSAMIMLQLALSDHSRQSLAAA